MIFTTVIVTCLCALLGVFHGQSSVDTFLATISYLNTPTISSITNYLQISGRLREGCGGGLRQNGTGQSSSSHNLAHTTLDLTTPFLEEIDLYISLPPPAEIVVNNFTDPEINSTAPSNSTPSPNSSLGSTLGLRGYLQGDACLVIAAVLSIIWVIIAVPILYYAITESSRNKRAAAQPVHPTVTVTYIEGKNLRDVFSELNARPNDDEPYNPLAFIRSPTSTHEMNALCSLPPPVAYTTPSWPNGESDSDDEMFSYRTTRPRPTPWRLSRFETSGSAPFYDSAAPVRRRAAYVLSNTSASSDEDDDADDEGSTCTSESDVPSRPTSPFIGPDDSDDEDEDPTRLFGIPAASRAYFPEQESDEEEMNECLSTTLNIYREPPSRIRNPMVPAYRKSFSAQWRKDVWRMPLLDTHDAFLDSPPPAASILDTPLPSRSASSLLSRASSESQSIIDSDEVDEYIRIALYAQDDAFSASEEEPEASYGDESAAAQEQEDERAAREQAEKDLAASSWAVRALIESRADERERRDLLPRGLVLGEEERKEIFQTLLATSPAFQAIAQARAEEREDVQRQEAPGEEVVEEYSEEIEEEYSEEEYCEHEHEEEGELDAEELLKTSWAFRALEQARREGREDSFRVLYDAVPVLDVG